MSKIESDTIEPSTGTSLTVGASGDIVTVPSGATLTVAGTLNVTGSVTATDKIDSAHYAAGSIDNEHLAANSVDSDQYVDGSIDNAHLAANSVDSDQYVDGSIDNAHLAANSVDSDQYVDGSIDNAHLAANSVDSDQYVDGSIDNAHLADDAVDSDELAAGSVDIAHLSATGTAGSGNYLRGDNSWQSAGGGWQLIETITIDNDAYAAFTSGIDNTYDYYMIRLCDIQPAGTGYGTNLRVSHDAGSNWEYASDDYSFAVVERKPVAANWDEWQGYDTNANSVMMVTHAIGLENASTDGLYAVIQFFNPAGTTKPKHFIWSAAGVGDGVPGHIATGGGSYQGSTAAITGVRYACGGGNIVSGTASLYGLGN
jgi:hypothetical protein